MTTYIKRNDTFYHSDTSPDVITVLESARINGARIRVFFGDTNTGRDWLEENDILGTIGRSTGEVKIPLLIHNARSMGGGAMLDNCIVKIVDTKTRRTLYQHPTYNQPAYTVGAPPKKIGNVDMKKSGYTHGVYGDGENKANFKSENAARRYISFMTGESFSK